MRRRDRIAIDFDGVIADSGVTKAKWINAEFSIRIDPSKSDRTNLLRSLTVHQYRRMQRSLGLAELLKTPAIDGSVEAIHELAANFSIVLLSARPAARLAMTERWLRDNGLLDYFSDLQSTYLRSKLSTASSLSCRVLIDDDIRHLTAKHPTGIRRILFSRVRQPEVRGVEVISTWREITACLVGDGISTRKLSSDSFL